MTFPRFLTHNLVWKIVSCVAAVLVWMAVKSGTPARLRPTEARTLRGLTITVMTSPADQGVFRVDPTVVDVRLSGPPDLIERVHPEEVHVFVDLTSAGIARDRRRRVEVYTPPGLTLVQVYPPEVRVEALAPGPDRDSER